MTFRIFLALLGLVALAACQTQTVNYERTLPQSVDMGSQALPSDVRLVAAAVLLRMKGVDPSSLPGVSYQVESQAVLQEQGFAYEGFGIEGLVILGYTPHPTRSGAAEGRELGALMILRDAANRRAAVRLLAHYGLSDSGVILEQASITHLHPYRPRVEAYLVPSDRLPDHMVGQVVSSHTALHSFAANNAVTPTEAAALGYRSYDLYMFSMDRTSARAKVEGLVSAVRNGTAGFDGGTDMLDYNGWQVAIIQGDFDPNARSPLYGKLVHTPGQEVPLLLRWSRLAGLYGLSASR